MSEDQNQEIKAASTEKLASVVSDAGDPATPTPEEERDTDRSTIWYCLKNGDYKILRITLMEQDAETLREWDADAARLREEISRMLVWHETTGGSPNVGS